MTEKSFVSLFAEKALRRPAAVYATFEGRKVTFAQLHRASDAIAHGLGAMGLARGDRVAVMMRNSPDSIAVLYGIAKRSEEHTSELQSLMRISYAVFWFKKKK